MPKVSLTRRRGTWKYSMNQSTCSRSASEYRGLRACLPMCLRRMEIWSSSFSTRSRRKASSLDASQLGVEAMDSNARRRAVPAHRAARRVALMSREVAVIAVLEEGIGGS